MTRKFRFTNGEYYHIYNRGVDKRVVFNNQYDFSRFLQSVDEFNSIRPIGSIFENSFPKNHQLRSSTPKLVEIVCFCLNKNHYHLVLRQLRKNGISEFMRKLGTGFTNYFNAENNRSGALFQGRFKAKHIDSNEYLLHVSAYVNLNNRAHKVDDSKKFRSSWDEYQHVNKKADNFCTGKNIILNQFNNFKEYKEFAESSLGDILERKKLFKEIEDLLME